jgi:flagellar biosynthesis protein FliQ
MTAIDALDLARESIWVLLIVSAPVMLIALAVGTVIGILQALTQVQEATIVFVPKIITVFLCLLFLLPFMGATMQAYMAEIVTRIAAG